jgi:hypothetical protein
MVDGRFDVKDAAGNVVTIVAVAEEIPVPSRDDPQATIPGMVSLFTLDGDEVFPVGNAFIINGRRYRKVDAGR